MGAHCLFVPCESNVGPLTLLHISKFDFIKARHIMMRVKLRIFKCGTAHSECLFSDDKSNILQRFVLFLLHSVSSLPN